MSKYIIIRDQEITSEFLKDWKLNSGRKLVNILDDFGNDTGFRVAKLGDEERSKEFVTYIKFNKDQIKDAILDIQAGRNVNTRVYNRIKRPAFDDPEGKRVRFRGAFKFKVSPGQTISQDFLITQDFYITGSHFNIKNAAHGDRIDFEVIHPQLGSLDKFIENWYVYDGSHVIDTYPAKILEGLIIRLTYYKESGVLDPQAEVLVNLLLHKV